MSRFKIDWIFTLVALALSGFSLALIWSVNPTYLLPQFVFFLVGFGLYFIISQFDTDVFYQFAWPFYLFSILFLLFTLVSGEIRGASRWIEIFGFGIQPAELVKPLLIISYAYFLSKFKLSGFFSIVKIIFLFFIPILIIFLQPDLGNAIIYFIFLSSMIIANNFNIKILVLLVLFSLIGSPLFWHSLQPYQKQRLTTFISPESDPQGAGYNAIQAMIAVGSGQFFGQGLGRGSQSHLRFLPENHTDFIFASLTEELGFFGACILLLFYTLIFIRILSYASVTDNKFEYLIIIGIFSQILAQVFINISMNIGLIPITGVTLPLVSSGGSSILATFVALGVIVALGRARKNNPIVIR